MTSTTRFPRTLVLGAGLALSTGALAACAGDDPSTDPRTSAAPTAQTTDAGAEATDGGTPSADTTGTTDPSEAANPDPTDAGEADLGAAEVAVTTATGELAGSTAYELDLADDGSSWEVDVSDGTGSQRVDVSADGATVENSRSTPLRDDDAAQLQEAEIDILQAMRIALGQQDGDIVEVDLDDENGTTIWDVAVRVASGDDRDLYIDAVTGELVSITD